MGAKQTPLPSKEELIRRLFLEQSSRRELEYLLQLLQEDDSEEGPEIMADLFHQLGTIPEVDPATSNRMFDSITKSIDEEQGPKNPPMLLLSGVLLCRLGDGPIAALLSTVVDWFIPIPHTIDLQLDMN